MVLKKEFLDAVNLFQSLFFILNTKLNYKLIFLDPTLSTNYSINNLKKLGFTVALNTTYATITKTSALNTLKSKCKATSLICIAGGAKGQDNLDLIACANCFNVLTQTKTINTPKLYSGVYWYFTPNYSFGFSYKSNIDQNPSDQADQNDYYRLSWNLDKSGGQRLGENLDLGSSNNYSKYAFILA